MERKSGSITLSNIKRMTTLEIIKTTEEIKRARISGAGGIQMSYCRKKWVSVESLKYFIKSMEDFDNKSSKEIIKKLKEEFER